MDTFVEPQTFLRPAKRRPKIMISLLLALYRVWLELVARLPWIGGALVMRRFLTPPSAAIRLSPRHNALWRTAVRQTIQVAGVPCPVYRWAPEESVRGCAVVCHGWAADARSMLSITEDLLARGFTVWAVDAPAHGRAGGRQSSLPAFIRAVQATMDLAGPVDIIVGHSFGAAAVAMAVAGRAPFGPARTVGGVVLMSSPHHHRTYPNFFVGRLGLGETVRRKLYAGLDHRFGSPETVPTIGKQLSTLDCPLMLIHDEEDKTIPVDQLNCMVAALSEPSYRVIRTRGLGHVHALHEPRIINAIGAFADETPRRRGNVARPSTPATESGPISVGSVAASIAEQIRRTPSAALTERFDMFARLFRLQDMLEKATDPGVRSALIDRILPPPNRREILQLIAKSSEHALQNPYLVEAVAQLAHDGLDDLRIRKAEPWSKDAVGLITYAVLLERLTVACRQDWRLLRALVTHWRGVRKEIRWHRYTKRFVVLKLLSVEFPLVQLLRYLKSRAVPSSLLKWSLPLNILEAVSFDLASRRVDNGVAGAVLARFGHRAASISADGNAVQLNLPAAKSWVDLYTVWNLGFVLRYAHYPFSFVKLLIPQVSGSASKPQEYIYNRVIALYAHVHMVAFLSTSGRPFTDTDYRDERLDAIWGASARRSAEAYRATATTSVVPAGSAEAAAPCRNEQARALAAIPYATTVRSARAQEIDESTIQVFDRTDLPALLKLIKDSGWGQRLSTEQQTELIERAEIRRYEPGARIYAEGEVGDTMAVVIQGAVEVRKSHSDRVYRQASMTRGQAFGESALLANGRRCADVYAVEPSQILMIRPGTTDTQWVTAVAVGMVAELARRSQQTTERAVVAAAKHDEETNRRGEIARFLTLLIVCLSAYTVSFGLITTMVDRPLLNSAFTTLSLLALVAASGLLIRTSTYPRAFFGLAIDQRWPRQVGEAVGLALVMCLGATVLKAVLVSEPFPLAGQPVFNPAFGVGAVGLLTVVYVAFCPVQELIARGVLQGAAFEMFQGRPFAVGMSILLSNAMFAAVHAHVSVWLSLVSFGSGLCWGLLYHRQRSLLGVSICHAIVGVYGLEILGFWGIGRLG